MRGAVVLLSLAIATASAAQEPQALAALKHLKPQPNAGPFSWTAGPYRYDGAGNIIGMGSEGER